MWGWGAVPAIDWFIASWLHTQLFAHSVKLDPGTFPIFSLPAGTMVSVFSRGRYRDTVGAVFCSWQESAALPRPPNPATPLTTPGSATFLPSCESQLCPLQWGLDLSQGVSVYSLYQLFLHSWKGFFTVTGRSLLTSIPAQLAMLSSERSVFALLHRLLSWLPEESLNFNVNPISILSIDQRL